MPKKKAATAKPTRKRKVGPPLPPPAEPLELAPDEEEEDEDPKKFQPPPWLTEPYAILRVHTREYYRLQRARIRAVQQLRWLKRWYPTIAPSRLAGIEHYGQEQKRLESAKKREIERELLHFPLWTAWLEGIKGVGPILAANILGEGGPLERFDKVSQVWRYWGTGVKDGRTEYAEAGEKRHFSRHLKTARWKIGKSFVMTEGPYRDWYAQRKGREEARMHELCTILCGRRNPAAPACAHQWTLVPRKSAGTGNKYRCAVCTVEIAGVQAYADMRARRWTGKLFLSHAWEVARSLAGLPTGYAYAISVLGHPVEHQIPPPRWTRSQP